MSSEVKIKSKVLDWALTRAGLEPYDIEDKFPKLDEWLKGKKYPTLRQLEALAKTTKTPLGFLFLEEPPEERLPVPFFRTFEVEDEKLSPDLLDTIQMMKRRQEWMREYLIDIGQDPLPFVNSVEEGESESFIAKSMRETLQLEEDWASQLKTWEEALRNLREAFEEIGILVVFNGVVGNNNHRSLDPGEFRGFVLVDDYAPLVFVNNKDVKAANMFTLAHELAHIFIGKSAAFDLRQMLPADEPIEQLCNKVAAEFLIPEKHLRETWEFVKNTPEPFNEIASQFKVSQLVAARRALDLRLINKSDFFYFYNNYKEDQRRRTEKDDSGGGDFYNNQRLRVGKRFTNAVVTAVKENKLSHLEAYRLTGLYGKTFDKFAASLGLRGLSE